MKKRVSEDFDNNHTRPSDTDCWIWMRAKNNAGYGVVNVPGSKQVLAHRFSYEKHHGAIPSGMLVMHTCDVRECVNPSHLELGSNKDNLQDMVRKGRSRFGVKHHSCKISENAAIEIYKSKETLVSLAAKYGITSQSVFDIKRGKNWSTVTAGVKR